MSVLWCFVIICNIDSTVRFVSFAPRVVSRSLCYGMDVLMTMSINGFVHDGNDLNRKPIYVLPCTRVHTAGGCTPFQLINGRVSVLV